MRADWIALAGALLVFPAAAQPVVGTLFHTAEERAALDRQRAGLGTGDDGLRDPVVTGYVKRSDGKSTVFLDNRPYRLDGRAEQRLLEPRLFVRTSPAPTSGTTRP